jgi:hypothetical protein
MTAPLSLLATRVIAPTRIKGKRSRSRATLKAPKAGFAAVAGKIRFHFQRYGRSNVPSVQWADRPACPLTILACAWAD